LRRKIVHNARSFLHTFQEELAMKHRLLFVMLIVAMLVSLTAVTALAQASDPIQAVADKYFSAGTKNIAAKDLYANLNDGDKSNDPYLIDIRAAADFANGHIPGAINMTAKDLFSADGLARLPKNRQIVVNCYTGQTASQTTAALRMLGFDAYNLLYGISGWGANDKIKYAFTAEQSGKYPVTKDVAQLPAAGETPKPLGATIQDAAIAYFPGGFKNIKAADVFANLNDGDKSNDPFIIDVRKPEDYALGHIAGAPNVTVANLFKTETLAKLPKSKQIVVYCYTGQTASQAVGALRMLGYDAWNMQFGLPAWAIVEGVSTGVFDQAKSSGNYTLVTATAPAAAPAPAAPATMPKTGAPLAALLLAGLGLTGVGLALRRR
jgi:rhodanese-related sulfurtransferase